MLLSTITVLDVHPAQCKVFTQVLRATRCTSHYVFKDVADYPESEDDSTRPSIVLYATTDAARTAYHLNTDDHKTKNNDESSSEEEEDVSLKTVGQPPSGEYSARMAWAWTSLSIEVKRPHRSSTRGADAQRQDANSRIDAHIAEIFLRQHRRFCFTVDVTKFHARLMRSDRNGTIVSTSVSLAEDPIALLNFVARYARMSPEEQGYDPTAILARSDVIASIQRRLDLSPLEGSCLPDYVRETMTDVLENQILYPMYEVSLTR